VLQKKVKRLESKVDFSADLLIITSPISLSTLLGQKDAHTINNERMRVVAGLPFCLFEILCQV
jgi:hypothetical protein